MNINRDNYELYFVQYVDGELTAAERKEVEAFAVTHPDLAEELDMIGQTKLKPDTRITFDKSLLYKEEPADAINMSNYETYFLLYTDNELGAAERQSVESFLNQHPELQSELALFRQTVSTPDPDVVFPDKDILYKKGQPAARVVMMRWVRMAVAAAVLVTAGLISYTTLFSDRVTDTETAGLTPAATKPAATQKENPVQKQVANPGDMRDVATTGNAPAAAQVTGKKDIAARTADFQPGNRATVSNPAADGTDETTTSGLPEREDVIPVSTIAMTSKRNQVPSETFNEDAVTPPVSKTLNLPETIVLDDEPNKKSRGFFRKATRVFERRTNINATDDDEKLLIGGFVVKMK